MTRPRQSGRRRWKHLNSIRLPARSQKRRALAVLTVSDPLAKTGEALPAGRALRSRLADMVEIALRGVPEQLMRLDPPSDACPRGIYCHFEFSGRCRP